MRLASDAATVGQGGSPGSGLDPATLVGNLVSGLAGAILALMGAFMLQARQNGREERAAARATFPELARNSANLAIMRDHGHYIPLEATTWRDTRATLANLLRPRDFAVVATAYLKVETLIVAMGSYQPGHPLTTEEQNIAGEVFNRVDTAASILELWGWRRPGERTELRDQLGQLAGSDQVTTDDGP